MPNLIDLVRDYKSISIVGMAKNAGKTTALNFLIEEAMDEGLRLGVTSIGRDGETQDLVTGTEKPRVYLDTDTLVAVPVLLYDLADASLEVVQRTNYTTAIGDLLICRVKEPGYVQIAGPVINAQQKMLCDDMLRLGCDVILIDGAIDRKSIASPETSDAIILATGAVLSRKIEKVIEETAHVINLYRIEELEEGKLRADIEKNIDEEKVILVDKDGKLQKLDVLTSLGSEAARQITGAVNEDIRYIYIPGAFTASLLADLGPKRLKQVHFILKDPTKIFINPMDWGIYTKKGFTINVLKNIKVAGVAVNPWSPAGYSFDNIFLLEKMREAIPDIPVFDVRM